MQTRRAQAATEVIAVVGVVVALVGAGVASGAFAWLPATLQRAAAAVGGASPTPGRAGLDFLDRAIARPDNATGPLLRDAILRLSRDVGPDAARALAITRLLRRYGTAPSGRRRALADPSWSLARPAYDGLGAGTADVWSQEEPRAPTIVRLVAPADERRWADAQRVPLAQRVVDLGVAGAIGLAGALSPETSVAAIALGAGAAALDEGAAGVPAGSRDGDALVCRFVWRRNLAAPGWAPEHPVDALRLALGERLPAVELVVIRAGTVLSRAVVRSDAATC